MVQRSAQGKFRLGTEGYHLLYGRHSSDDDQWMPTLIDLIAITPDLDHPQCIRFTSLEDVNRLQVIQNFCTRRMNAYVNITADPEVDFTDFELITTTITGTSNVKFVHSDSPRIVTEGFWGICTIP
jgi:hypothetical protein